MVRFVLVVTALSQAGADYQEAPATTCWNGHGGVDIDSDDTAQARMTVDSCQNRCDADPSCTCVAFRPSDGKCWKRSACVISECGQDSNFNTYIKEASPPPPTPVDPTWEEPLAKAKAVVATMSRDEKASLMTGIGWENGGLKDWWYVGNIPAVPGKFSGLNMQDNGNGFRTIKEEIVGTVTVWPSALSLGATWDRQIVRDSAVALGKEFRGKGANVILGPAINVHRYAKGGRNFEYMSGDDPLLGAELTRQWVEGVQSQNVMACAKHFAGNQEETERGDYDSEVDEKTAWELYYPPYQAAVDSGVGSFMCSYNKWNGEHSCSNSKLLKQDLKGAMGFKGFVMSDWGATYDQADRGLDMDMRMGGDSWNPSSQTDDVLDDTATRVLAAVNKVKADWISCTGACEAQQRSMVATAKHAELATSAAAASIVLLQNDGVLPVSSEVKSIAVVGKVATADAYDSNYGAWNQGDYYSGGGSGHMTPSAQQLVKTMGGIKSHASSRGIAVHESGSNDHDAAVAAASDADVVFVVVGATSTESQDRDSLSLDDDGDGLIDAVAAIGKKVVVLMQVPGVVLTPWRDSVAAVAAMFLGGQGTGEAWARILFGDQAPAGRLPVQFPATEDDTIGIQTGSVRFSEGLATSYRNKQANFAYPFGHGLTYTTFKYGDADLTASCGSVLCISFSVKNAGAVAATDTPQVYVEFPAAAEHPAPLLKGFEKTDLIQPGESAQVTIALGVRELSYWDSGSWVQAPTVSIHIGSSSAQIAQTLPDVSTGSAEELVA